ncbi:hypothetical protein EB001_08725 [bacterium]|nr:hypothetical protein [bacterium]
MLYYSSILKDSPVGFWKLDESSGPVAYDSSGCGNNGSYYNGINKVDIPLVPGGAHANKITDSETISFEITKDFSGQAGIGGFGIQKTEDNDFSLEVWFHPKNITGLTPILADDSGIGIYWDNGNIVFKVESERIDYTVPYRDKSFHIVATYETNVIRLYVDSELVANKFISPITFSNESLSIESGPALSGEYFLIDSPAIYRYSLNINKVKSHYQHVDTNTSVQVVKSNFGQLFKSTLQHQYQPDQFAWPAYIPFTLFENDNIIHRKTTNSLYLSGTSNAYFVTSIGPSSSKNYVSSKIEWFGGQGISIYSSLDYDGENTVWNECTNGSYIPGICLGETFLNEKEIYFKVEFNSEDINLYIPELYYIGVYLYEDKKLYSHNGRSFISTSETTSVSCWDVDFSNREYQLISRNYDNGIRSLGAGFYLETVDDTQSVELIVTPKTLGAGYLMYNKTDNVEYSLSWTSNGTLTKSNISGLYINGQDVSSSTNISSYLNIDEPNYILIKTTDPVTGQIWFNTKSENSIRTGTLDNNLYTLIAIYGDSNIDHLTNYNIYVGNESVSNAPSVITLNDIGPVTYDFDWVVLDNA